MRKLPETIQPPAFGFDKPAKERIIEASDKLFRLLGIRVADSLIAQDAHSNVDTFRKYFGDGEPLIGRFVRSLIAECEDYWRGLAAEHPNDPASQLRWCLPGKRIKSAIWRSRECCSHARRRNCSRLANSSIRC